MSPRIDGVDISDSEFVVSSFSSDSGYDVAASAEQVRKSHFRYVYVHPSFRKQLGLRRRRTRHWRLGYDITAGLPKALLNFFVSLVTPVLALNSRMTNTLLN